MNKREPTMEDALRKLDQEIQETVAERVSSPTDYAPPEVRNSGNGKRPRKVEPIKEPREDKNTWLKSMAEALLDARYEEMMILAEGIKADPKVIHQWAKTYVGE